MSITFKKKSYLVDIEKLQAKVNIGQTPEMSGSKAKCPQYSSTLLRRLSRQIYL